jgi:hypothetical protein
MSQLKKIGMLNRAGMDACNAGHTEDALFQLTRAEEMARRLKSPLHEAKVRNNIGLVHQMAGNREEALVCFRLAERRAAEGGGQGNPLQRIITRNLDRLQRTVVEEAA